MTTKLKRIMLAALIVFAFSAAQANLPVSEMSASPAEVDTRLSFAGLPSELGSTIDTRLNVVARSGGQGATINTLARFATLILVK